MSFREYAERDARLVILRALAEEHDYRLNERLIGIALETYGHNWSRERVRAEIGFLEELGAVTRTDISGFMVATITRRGLDHVERKTQIEGVARPSPEA